MTAVQKPSTWTTDIMDSILREGDNLYQHIDVGHDFLLPTDLPVCVHLCNRIFNVVRGKEAFGSFTIFKKQEISYQCYAHSFKLLKHQP